MLQRIIRTNYCLHLVFTYLFHTKHFISLQLYTKEVTVIPRIEIQSNENEILTTVLLPCTTLRFKRTLFRRLSYYLMLIAMQGELWKMWPVFCTKTFWKIIYMLSNGHFKCRSGGKMISKETANLLIMPKILLTLLNSHNISALINVIKWGESSTCIQLNSISFHLDQVYYSPVLLVSIQFIVIWMCVI